MWLPKRRSADDRGELERFLGCRADEVNGGESLSQVGENAWDGHNALADRVGRGMITLGPSDSAVPSSSLRRGF